VYSKKHYVYAYDAVLYGYEDSYHRQWEATRVRQVESLTARGYDAFLQGNDVFVSLPTGNGMSIIYADLPHTFDKLR
jgi:superfamily II DNA helicase RecQ